MRETMIERLERDLVGPDATDEVLASRPSDVYLTGILWPRQTRMTGEEDEHLGLQGAESAESSGAGEDEEVSLAGQTRPCAAGVSFAAAGTDPAVDVRLSFARYDPDEDADDGTGRRRRTEWHRRGFELAVTEVRLSASPSTIDLEEFGAPSGTKLHVRSTPSRQGVLATVMLLNYTAVPPDGGRRAVEAATLFQVDLEVRPAGTTELVARPSRRAVVDDDDRSADLLHRNALEFATGHTCSARWEDGEDSGTAAMVATTWTPSTTVPSTNPDGHAVFDRLRGSRDRRPLSAEWLADAPTRALAVALEELPAAYGEWLDGQAAAIDSLPERHRHQAERNIEACRHVRLRMSEGAASVAADPAMARAFALANRAMAIQHSWDPDKSSRGPLEWRPFQLGFVLLAAASLADPVHPDRDVMDLLWFPTGGGKTEAYLALIAFLAFHRRLSADPPNGGDGVAAVMRYTLRLLTTQQFSRAAAMLLACEAIRRCSLPGADGPAEELGTSPFSIGLWVGSDAVPNTVTEAAAALGGAPDQPTPKQLLHCPACRETLHWTHNRQARAIEVRCPNGDCALSDPDHPLPVWTVDEDVYRRRPTLLVGTIDKFAQIVRRKEIGDFFGLARGTPPDLVLQDELHLISGPLGTVAGLYEAAIDRMFSAGGSRPKVIGSTATIRRASDQVLALFDRRTEQFPPPCLDADDSGFAVIDDDLPGRVYAGVTTAGRSAKFTLQAVAGSLLQSAAGAGEDDHERDPYWTLLSYFNSLRELGGALVLMQDDVNDSIQGIARRRGEDRRQPGAIEELTSRRTQEEVRDMLELLSIPAGADGVLDAVLATNMVSVGVDIPRLGLMLVNGQPKGIAEYIQATSRVGRGRVAGLIVALLNNAKARDRSHYESFATWHGTLYRDVEPTSVTPFASRARDRALHAVLVALVRHLVPGMLDRPRLDDGAIAAAMELIRDIADRAEGIDPEEDAVRSELEGLLENWAQRAPPNYWAQPSRSLLQDAERAATMRAMGRRPGDAWPTMNNMRSVEPSTPFRLAERLRTQDSEEEEHGA